MKIQLAVVAAALTVSTVMPGCSSMTGATKGTGIGAIGGAGLGALIGKATGNTAVGAAVGGVVGGTAGHFIGKYMDKQKKDIQDAIPGAVVEEINNGESLKVTFESKVLFDTDKFALKSESQKAIQELSGVLNKYPDTYVEILGHTDNTGKPEYNMTLSQKRAEAVMNQAVAIGVDRSRLQAQGMGITKPVADNGTVDGRAENRRVEFFIVANEKLKQDAAKSVEGQ